MSLTLQRFNFCLQLDEMSHKSQKEFETIDCTIKKDIISG